MNENMNQEANCGTHLSTLNNPIAHAEVKRCIRNLINGQSCGSDNNINEYIIYTRYFFPLCFKLFNNIVDTGVFSPVWWTGVIVHIYKNTGDVNATNNYRGITLVIKLDVETVHVHLKRAPQTVF